MGTSVTCTLRNGRRVPVRAAGKSVRGYMSPSITTRAMLGLFAQELNVRLHQHEHRLSIDRLPWL